MHLVVINPTNGEVCWAIVFDTYKSSDALNEFILRGLPTGYIVVAACKDEMTTELSGLAKHWLGEMGSLNIWKLEYRDSFVFIGRSNQNGTMPSNTEFNEKSGKEQVSISQVFKLTSES